MFGNFAPFISAPSEVSKPPKSVPPPTPVNFPRYQQNREGHGGVSGAPKAPLTSVLQNIIRPADVTADHLEALGVQLTSDAPTHQVIPYPEALPDFNGWDALSRDECHAQNEATRYNLSNGNLSPGCLVYLDRKRELSTPNSAAFRAVRRIQPAPGQSQARLGNSYEFFRFLEMFAVFWDDTSRSSKSPEQRHSEDGPGADSTMSESDTSTDSPETPRVSPDAPVTYRTGSGHNMPPEFRQNIMTAFLKVVVYDFGCNVSPPRIEPRLYLTSTIPSTTGGESQTKRSHFASGCRFIFRTPTTREAARAGIVEGPIAAVSARHTTAFPPSPHARSAPSVPNTDPSSAPTALSTSSPSSRPKALPEREAITDLSRELVSALVTAQYRARQHKTETRIGQNAWWATKPRWGGGTGGPIGREIDMLTSTDEVLVGDKDAPPSPESPPEISILAAGSSLVSPYPSASRPSGIPSRLAALNTNPMIPEPENDSNGTVISPKGRKRLKKGATTLPMYANYRTIRPPSSNWDKKVRYEAIGRVPGADYDDIFVMSSLFHHISVMRVRVPDRLLDVLDGAEETEPMSWGGLMVWRSRWFDFFVPDDRVEAMKCVWGVMSWTMRRNEDGKES